MSSEVQGLFHYIKQSPTAFHAVQTAAEMLDGFTALNEHDRWQLKPGGKYYVTRNRSALIAFTMPADGDVRCFQLVASHTDSPTFKIKEICELKTPGKYVRLDVEKYGGMIMSSWYDRPLSVAGRVMVRTACGVETRLVNIDRDLLMITNVAIHMNREINNGYKYNPAVDTMPLYACCDAPGAFMQEIAEAAGVDPDAIIGHDLFLYSRMPGITWGYEEAMLSCNRLDDLECVYSSLRAFAQAKPAHHVNVCCIMDNEEVGSGTKQGADSTMLTDVLRRIMLSTGHDEEDYIRALSASFMLSADNAHATHPNHPELSDPLNQVEMNKGIVIKFNANQKYTTDAVSQSVFRSICKKADVPVQFFANRSDLLGGSTLGNICGSHVSINCIDIGLAQLAMHSCYETAGVKDLEYMIQGMRAFYETDIDVQADGVYSLSVPEA